MKDFNLHKNKIQTGFTTPENYFDDFASKVMQQLPDNEVKVVGIWNNRKKWYYAAAAILVLTLSIPVMNVIKSNNTEIDIKAENNYITYNTRITQDDLLEHITLDELKAININSNVDKDAANDALYDADLENYLINQSL
jgi:hypothetical protein